LDRPPPPKLKPPAKEVVPLIDADYQAMYMDSAKKATYAAVGLLGVGMISPNNPYPNPNPGPDPNPNLKPNPNQA